MGEHGMISIFTPTHRGDSKPWLREAWETILEQTMPDWEWVLITNSGAHIPDDIVSDKRVRIIPYPFPPEENGRYNIGALKKFAADQCRGDILLEFDDDDLLTPNALEVLQQAYADPDAMMVYCNTAEFKSDTWEPNTYSAWWGWQTRDFTYKGHELKENISWPPGPWCLRHIYWSPNHLRSWRTSAYRESGGHDPKLALVDDHEMNIRFYLLHGEKGVKHIDQCLYLYRVHGDSTCRRYAADIRAQDQWFYNKYIVELAKRWASDHGLPVYDFGGAINPTPGFITVDQREGADIVCDLEQDWPFETSSVGIVRACHVFEHLSDPIHTMNELYRVLAPGGFAFIELPSTDGRGAWQDPTHKSWWNENSFFYYTRKTHALFVPEYTGRFQISDLRTYFPSKWYEDNKIPCVRAHLIALKPGYEERRAGEILI